MLELHYARRARRHVVDLPCQLISRDFDAPLNHLITDLSAFGMWIQTTFPLDVGHHVVVAFAPADRGEVTLFAEVARVAKAQHTGRAGCLGASSGTGRASGMGLEFLGLSRHERADLLGALRALPDETLEIMRFGRAMESH